MHHGQGGADRHRRGFGTQDGRAETGRGRAGRHGLIALGLRPATFGAHPHEQGYLHLLAEAGDTEAIPVGWAFARGKELDPLFKPTRVLHVHALYVSPAYRRQGIGRALLEAVLEWGRSEGCVQAELNVLVDNPARGLYDQLGFDAFEIEMARKL